MAIKERHLGLHMPREVSSGTGPLDYISRLASLVERNVELDLLLELAGSFTPDPAIHQPLQTPAEARVRLAVAYDDAFCFYYQE